MYIGLLNFTILLVFGIAGLTASFNPGPGKRHQPAASTELREFQLPPNLTDAEAAAVAWKSIETLGGGDMAKNSIRRDSENNLTFVAYSQSGMRTITLLEKKNRLRIEARKNSFWHYVDEMHTTTVNRPNRDTVVRLWTWYTEFSIWSLILMPISGVYLWLASRPRFRWAQISFATGGIGFLLLYVITR